MRSSGFSSFASGVHPRLRSQATSAAPAFTVPAAISTATYKLNRDSVRLGTSTAGRHFGQASPAAPSAAATEASKLAETSLGPLSSCRQRAAWPGRSASAAAYAEAQAAQRHADAKA